MPRRIELTRAALADFDDIYDYIARDNPRAAAQVLRSLDESIQLLSGQPKMGKVFRHRRLRLRLLTHDDYLVFYRERPGVIEIVEARLGGRDFEAPKVTGQPRAATCGEARQTDGQPPLAW